MKHSKYGTLAWLRSSPTRSARSIRDPTVNRGGGQPYLELETASAHRNNKELTDLQHHQNQNQNCYTLLIPEEMYHASTAETQKHEWEQDQIKIKYSKTEANIKDSKHTVMCVNTAVVRKRILILNRNKLNHCWRFLVSWSFTIYQICYYIILRKEEILLIINNRTSLN